MSGMQVAHSVQHASFGCSSRSLPERSQLGKARAAARVDGSHCWPRVSIRGSSRCCSCGKFISTNLAFGSFSLPSTSGTFPVLRKRGGEVVCMAQERRVKMVSQQVKREISQMLLYDKVLQATVLPETALGADMYLTAVATISDVEMSKDLSVAKVYISIYGDERGQVKALEGLKNKSGYVRKLLAQRMNLKNTPEVRFIKDEALERGSRVIAILDKLKKERALKDGIGVQDGYADADESEHDDDQEKDKGDLLDEAGKDEPKSSFSRSGDDEGDGSEWDDDENITFIT